MYRNKSRVIVIIAIILSFHSIDFLLQYSFHDADAQPIHSQSHHLGDIIKTHATKIHHNIIIAIISTSLISK